MNATGAIGCGAPHASASAVPGHGRRPSEGSVGSSCGPWPLVAYGPAPTKPGITTEGPAPMEPPGGNPVVDRSCVVG